MCIASENGKKSVYEQTSRMFTKVVVNSTIIMNVFRKSMFHRKKLIIKWIDS